MEAPQSGIEVVRAGPGDLDEVIAVRLRALADAPYAFGSTLRREQAFGRAEWEARMARGLWWLARMRGGPARPVGLVAGIRDPDEPSYRQLVGMWVDPAVRGGPAAGALVSEVVAWAAAEGTPALVLWVADGNVRARRLYERMGFRPSGRRQPLPSRPDTEEEQMIHPFPVPSPAGTL